MPRVLVAGKLHASGLHILDADPNLNLDYIEDISAASMEPYLATAEAILLRTQPLDAEAVKRCPVLKIVSRHGVGYDAVDVDALNARAIPLTIVGDVNAQTVAEHAMLLMLSSSRRLLSYDASTRVNGDWNHRNSLTAKEICGKTLLIIGCGRIGRHLARMAAGFDIRVIAHDPYLTGEPPEGVTMVPDLRDGLRMADLVSLHMPKTDRPVLGADEIALLKPDAVLVNTARGGAIDEHALALALSEGRLHGAGLDVFAAEPPGEDNPIIKRPEAVLTPHSASMTAECAERMAMKSAENIVNHFAGSLDPGLVVNAKQINFRQGTIDAAIPNGGPT